jgi:hypothetical protein
VSQETVPLDTVAEEGASRSNAEGQRIWWFVLLAALALLAFEGWLANRKGKRARVWNRSEAADSV